MYRVALCEDEKVYSAAQEKICRHILDNMNIDYQISVFDDSASFSDAFFIQHQRHDLILLDIMMEGVDGMTLARRIRKADSDVAIIFITANKDYALDGYDVDALHYLMKPVDSKILAKLIMGDYRNRFQINYVCLELDARKLLVKIKDIISLETVKRRVVVTLKDDKTIYYNGKLTELLTKLPEDKFARCHQSYAVNIKNIRELTRQEIIAINGKTIPVSRTFANDVQKKFLKQMREI